MNDYAKKVVVYVTTVVGTYLAAWGLVSADVWSQLMSTELVAGLSAILAAIIYGIITLVTTWVAKMMNQPKVETK